MQVVTEMIQKDFIQLSSYHWSCKCMWLY